jgi:hypothetical protein
MYLELLTSIKDVHNKIQHPQSSVNAKESIKSINLKVLKVLNIVPILGLYGLYPPTPKATEGPP